MSLPSPVFHRWASRFLALALGFAVPFAAPAFCADARAEQSAKIDIPFQKYKLDNGLVVILHEDHSLPLVVVNTCVKVGSRFEEPKRTGFAHLFEHLMFMGTKRVPPKMFDAWMEAEGGSNNAWTSEDRTDYFSVGPAHTLKLLTGFADFGQGFLFKLLAQSRRFVPFGCAQIISLLFYLRADFAARRFLDRFVLLNAPPVIN